LGEEKWPVAESTGLGEVIAILRDAVEVLKGIRSGMRSLEEAIDGRYVPAESNKESEGEEAEETELIEELVGLSEEAAEYRAFWRSKHGKEYRAMVPEKDGRNVEEHMEVEEDREKEKERDEGDEMEVDGMVMGPSGSVD
jgi:Sec-independent protein translocase protein TatA